MVILVVSLGNFIVGSIIGPTDAEEIAKGFVGFNCKCIKYQLIYALFDNKYHHYDYLMFKMR